MTPGLWTRAWLWLARKAVVASPSIASRQRMLVVLARGWSGDPDLLETAEPALQQLCRTVGVVHYATAFLLPPDVEAGQTQPTLALELVADEHLAPGDLHAQLVAHDTDAVLWTLLAPSSDVVVDAPGQDRQAVPIGLRRRALCDFLAGCTHVADGAHVGARDRSVRRIKDEARLEAWARDQLPAQPDEDETGLAARLRHRVQRDPQLSWVREPVKRSVWRASHARNVLRIVGWMVLTWLGAWLVARVAFRLARKVATAGDGATAWASVHGLDGLLSGLGHAAWFAKRFVAGVVLAALAVALVAAVVAIARWLIPPLRRWASNEVIARLQKPMDSPASTAAGRAVGVGLWLLVPVVSAAPWLHVFDAPWEAVPLPWNWRPGSAYNYLQRTMVLALVLLTIVATVGVALRLVAAVAALAKSSAWWRAERPLPTRGVQQVHADVEDSEIRLAATTMHMISLTDIRRPRWLFARLATLGLRLVSLASRWFAANGMLGQAKGIQFAHWHVIDRRRLLFCSNYDGVFGGYLDAFILGAGRGVNLAWRFTELRPRRFSAGVAGSAATSRSPDEPTTAQPTTPYDGWPAVNEPRRFPPTRALVWRGCANELAFKAYARTSMLGHQARFWAYERSLEDIERASTLREALAASANPARDDTIVRALES